MRTGGLLIALLCPLVVGGCAAPSGANLRGAREACNREYPAHIGNYVSHARCVNAAIETYALPTARYPDLIRLQAEARSSISERIDRQRISIQAGEQHMAEADRLVAAAQREREAGNDAAAREQVAAIEQMLGRQGASSDFIVASGASPPSSLGPDGMGKYVLADGSVKDNIQLRLRELRIGDRAIRNVRASVARIQAKLLLGQTFLARFGSWTIDNRRKVLVLSQ
jgi:hypothetical protein